MKAHELVKKYIPLENIYENVKLSNDQGFYKIFFNHSQCVSDEVKLKLIADGFKVYIGDWDGVMKNALIIEW